METLQKKIEERAKNRLLLDLSFLENLHNLDRSKYFHLCEGISVNRGTTEKPDLVNPTCLFTQSGRLHKEIFEKNFPKYIEKETELFLREIEELKQKVELLGEQVDNIIL